MAKNNDAATKKSKTQASQKLEKLIVDGQKGPVEHVFVLMLENRSFDHLFGLSGIYGVQPPPSSFGFKPGAKDVLTVDPPHEYDDVAKQIANGAMTGFPQFGGADAMLGFEAGRNPILRDVAEAGLLMDNWYSSMPGPTWPNRFFAHAASSGGLDNSPGDFDIAQALSSSLYAYTFKGHIFDRMILHGKSWRVYRSDLFPQILSLPGMVEKRIDRTYFRKYSEFRTDVTNGDVAAYTWIEPAYDARHHYINGNSQHPLGAVSAGERLIRDTYNAIFQSKKVGKNSLLLVTWDEHGGFFDRSAPPAATPPGDNQTKNYERAAHPRDCKFDRLGPRVPALIVSPWLRQGLGSKVFPGATYDHSSIISFLREVFQLGEPLTNRDATAPSWHTAFLTNPRSIPVLTSKLPALKKRKLSPIVEGPVDGNLLGTLEIAIAVDWDIATKSGSAPLLATAFREKLHSVHRARSGKDATLSLVSQKKIIIDYLAAVESRDLASQKSRRTSAAKKAPAQGVSKGRMK